VRGRSLSPRTESDRLEGGVPSCLIGLMKAHRDRRSWQIGTIGEVSWVANGTTDDTSITGAIPPVFEAYATFYEPDEISTIEHERAVVNQLFEFTPDQPWWLGYLDTGAHSVGFGDVPKVTLYSSWHYVLSKPSTKTRWSRPTASSWVLTPNPQGAIAITRRRAK
jgi:hypothetical protein